VLSRKSAVTTGKTKTRRSIQRVSEKMDQTRSEILPGHNDMPRNALQRGGGNHRHGRFHEHFDGMLR